MKKIFVYTLLFSFLLSISVSSLNADSWTQKAIFPGTLRELSACFSIAEKGYVCCGLYTTTATYLNDLWQYDPVLNVWTQKADLPAMGRYGSAGFSINDKGYVGTGNDGSVGLQDFWEYDASTNSWAQMADFGNSPRWFASGFSIGTKGYIGCGLNDYDLWEWDQATNIWTQKINLPFLRYRAVGFSLNGKGYFTTGLDSASNYLNDIWEYDPAFNSWTQKTSLPAAGRADAAAFVICDKGYVGTGGEAPFYKDLWQFDPQLNQWMQKTSVPGPNLDDCAYFALNHKGYICLGQINGSTYTHNLFEYTPDSSCITGIGESFNPKSEFMIFPNPAKEFIILNSEKEKINLTITDVNGKIIIQTQLSFISHQSKISLNGFSQGIYFATIDNGKEKTVKKFLKE